MDWLNVQVVDYVTAKWVLANVLITLQVLLVSE
jgi:hypothetical protein